MIIKSILVLVSFLLFLPGCIHATPNAKDVNIVNTADNPVPVSDVNNPAWQPFQWRRMPSFPANTSSSTLQFQVPADKTLVIEFASASVIIQETGQIAGVAIETLVNSELGTYRVPLHRKGTVGTEERFEGAQEMRVYADPGTTVYVQVGRTVPGNGIANFTVSISGYLVDLL